MYIFVCMYVCMYVYMYVCKYVCRYAFTYPCGYRMKKNCVNIFRRCNVNHLLSLHMPHKGI